MEILREATCNDCINDLMEFDGSCSCHEDGSKSDCCHQNYDG